MIRFSEYFVGACFLIFIAVWIVTAFFTKRTVERAGLRWSFGLPVAIVLLVRGALQWVTGGQVNPIAWPPSAIVAAVADLTALSGLLLAFWARFTLGRNWSASPVFKENHELICDGPYAYMRHPIYTAVLLMVLGVTVLTGRVVVFAMLALLALGFVLKARLEETLLTRHFPDAYPEYKSRVKAFIPWVY